MSLKIDLRVGESVKFDGGRVTVTLLEKSGRAARLEIDADQSVVISHPRSSVSSDIARNGLTVFAGERK